MTPIGLRRNSLLALALFASAALAGGALAGDVSDAERAIKAEDALAKVKALASDELEGRRAGTASGRKAREWIFGQLKAIGLAPEYQVFEVGTTRCSNVIAVLEGTRGGEEHVVVGAHYDHVGRGEDGNGIDLLGGNGEIHNGADDNASGSAALLEVAAALVRYGRTARTVVLVWFDGEERGLWGSQHYVEAPKLPLEKCVAMINMDMVGRLRARGLQVIGANSGAGLGEIVAAENRAVGLRARFDPYMVPNSDHFSFYSKRVPVVFLCTGLHGEYHRTTDKWPTINAAGMAQVARLAFRTAVAVAEGSERLAYEDVPMAPVGAMALEFLEGFTGIDALETLQRRIYGSVGGAFVHVSIAGGLAVGYVEPGSLAAEAGIRPGDRLVRAGRFKLEGPFARLTFLTAVATRAGSLEVEARRGGETLVLHLGGSLADKDYRPPAKKKTAAREF